MPVRPFRAADLPALHAINEAGTPGVSRETPETLAEIIGLSECLVAETPSGDPLGFLTLVPPGTAAYASLNLRWFEALGGNLTYVDRIAVSPAARGQGIGEALYAAAFDLCRQSHDSIGCEVNSLPPNPGSLRFHTRLGFVQIGRQAFVPGEKEVIYLLRQL